MSKAGACMNDIFRGCGAERLGGAGRSWTVENALRRERKSIHFDDVLCVHYVVTYSVKTGCSRCRNACYFQDPDSIGGGNSDLFLSLKGASIRRVTGT